MIGNFDSVGPHTSVPKQNREQSNYSLLIIGLALASIIALTIFAYSPVLFNFFNGDDFVHLTWLKEAVKNQELIWRNFHSSWLDGTTTRFYRPLISVFMVTDYLMWKTNGLGFHLTNLVFHLASTIFLFLIVKELAAPAETKNTNINGIAWALAASALFGLYPLHPEAVSWITGRVDSVVTPFCLFSLLSFIYWRQSGNLLWSILSTASMWLALFSKEMAITLPAIFVLWEVLYGAPKQGNFTAWLTTKFKSVVVHTGWFWLMLAVYFFVRVKALGTFVGGYDDSLLYISNWNNFLGGWLHGLKKLYVPYNASLMNTHSWCVIIWQASTIISACLALWGIAVNRQLIKPVAFLSLWFLLCLAPVYKIFAIADDLQGSRLAYLATVPLCALMTAAFAVWSRKHSRIKNIFQAVVLAVFLLTATTMLWTNNQAWAEAGRESNAIRKCLDDLYRTIPGDPQVMFIGLPDEIEGAYVSRNALWGMTKSPQMHRDTVNALMVNSFEPIFPFGYLKDSIYQNRDQVKLFRWDSINKIFLPVTLPSNDSLRTETRTWQGQELRQVLNPLESGVTAYSWQPDGSLKIQSAASARKQPEIVINFGKVPCWFTNFIVIDIATNMPASTSLRGAELLYSNDMKSQFELKRRTHAELGLRTIFPLHGLPEWACGGYSDKLKLLLPPNFNGVIESIAIVPPEYLMPIITFEKSDYLGTKGYLHLASKQSQLVTVNFKSIPKAVSAEIEITRPNLLFENQNTTESSRVISKTINIGNAGSLVLRRQDFAATGIYELRARAVDVSGKPVGVASDHIVISVD